MSVDQMQQMKERNHDRCWLDVDNWKYLER